MHVVQFANNKYAVRRFTLLGPVYLDRAEVYWWRSRAYIEKYCLFDSAELARQRARESDLRVTWKGSIR